MGPPRTGGREAECTGLLNRRRGISPYRGFESRPVRSWSLQVADCFPTAQKTSAASAAVRTDRRPACMEKHRTARGERLVGEAHRLAQLLVCNRFYVAHLRLGPTGHAGDLENWSPRRSVELSCF